MSRYTTEDFINVMFDEGQQPFTTGLPSKSGRFFTPNPSRGNNASKDITHHQTFFFEWDKISIAEQGQKIKGMGLTPTAVVFSGNKSLHVFFRLAVSLPAEEWRSIQAWLLNHFEADQALKDPGRLMRLGGFEEQKIRFLGKRIENEKFFSWLTGLGYQPAPQTPELERQEEGAGWTELPDNFKSNYAGSRLKKEALKVAGAMEGERNATLNRAAFTIGTYIADGALSREDGFSTLKRAARKAGLAESEIAATLSSAFGSATADKAWYPDPEGPEPERLVIKYLNDHGLRAFEVETNEMERLNMARYFGRKNKSERDDMFNLYLHRLALLELAELRKGIGEYQPVPTPKVGWILTKDNPESVQAVIEHFIWLVKRKALGLPVDHHLMPVFVGGQGSGKTTFLKKFLEVIPPVFRRSCEVPLLCDERAQKGLAEALVIFCDEMAGATKAEYGTLKNWITSSEISYRPMRSNHMETVKNYSTNIGASNKNVDEMIKDESGMRRFYQVQCNNLINGKLDWKAINQIDFKQLWLSVNPEKPTPITGRVEEVTTNVKVQESMEAWLNEAGFDPGLKDWIPSAEIHQHYVRWCYANGYKNPKDSKTFSPFLELNGWKKKKTKSCNVFQPPPEDWVEGGGS